MSETASEPSYYRSSIRVEESRCEPCSGHRINQHVVAQTCTSIKNNTFFVVTRVNSTLHEASYLLKSYARQLHKDLGADRQFNPYRILDLEDIEKSSINVYLRNETRQEQILHYSFARVVLVQSFLEEAKKILRRERENDSNLNTVINRLTKVTCKLYDFTFMLHVSNISKGVCTYIKPIILTERHDAWNYVLSVFNYTETILDLVIKDISDLNSPSVTDSCVNQSTKGINLVYKKQKRRKRQKKREQRKKCKGKRRGCKKSESRKKRKDNSRKNKIRRNKKSRERNRQNQTA